MGIMGISAQFINAAGRGGKKAGNYLMFSHGSADPTITISCVGDISVESTKDGGTIIESYSNLNSTAVSVRADANTQVMIKGDVTLVSGYGDFNSFSINPDNVLQTFFMVGSTVDKLNFSGSKSLKSITISSTTLTTLSCRNCSALTTLTCSGCSALTSLDVAGLTALTSLTCSGCSALTTLTCNGCSALTTLTCSGCSVLTSLDVAGLTALTTLDCANCSTLTSLDAAGLTALTTLTCTGCSALTSLDATGLTALTTLTCTGCSALTSLDVAGLTALTSLSCRNCSALTSLDIAGLTALTSLPCSGCSALTTIKYQATDENVSIAVAGAITGADAADGTVYTDSAAAYYSTIANAATAKGWTIEQLS